MEHGGIDVTLNTLWLIRGPRRCGKCVGLRERDEGCLELAQVFPAATQRIAQTRAQLGWQREVPDLLLQARQALGVRLLGRIDLHESCQAPQRQRQIIFLFAELGVGGDSLRHITLVLMQLPEIEQRWRVGGFQAQRMDQLLSCQFWISQILGVDHCPIEMHLLSAGDTKRKRSLVSDKRLFDRAFASQQPSVLVPDIGLSRMAAQQCTVRVKGLDAPSCIRLSAGLRKQRDQGLAHPLSLSSAALAGKGHEHAPGVERAATAGLHLRERIPAGGLRLLDSLAGTYMRIVRSTLLVLLALMSASISWADTAPAADAPEQTNTEHSESQQIIAETELSLSMARDGQYGRISKRDLQRLEAAQARVVALLAGVASPTQLVASDKQALERAQVEINSILRHDDDNRRVCKRVAATGTRLGAMECMTVAERRQRARSNRDAVQDMQRGVVCLSGEGKWCSQP